MDPAAFSPESPALHRDLTSPSHESPPSSLFRNLLSYVGIIQRPTVNPIQHQGDMRTASRWSLLNTRKKDTLNTVLDSWVSQAEEVGRKDRINVVKSLKQSKAKLKNGNIVVAGNLDFGGFTGLTSLPENLKVGGNLNLYRCTGLTSLPESLEVAGNLVFNRCTGLTSLPESLEVAGYLDLHGCTGLTSLPESLEVADNLYLNYCTGLTSLPESLEVAGNLDLHGCTGLTSLPESLKVGGTLALRDCTDLTSLPNWITTLGFHRYGRTRLVFISNTGLSEETLERLRQADAPGMRFIFSQQASEYTGYGSLDDALTSWGINPTAEETEKWHLNDIEEKQLTTFLSRMHNTSEARNAHTQSSFKNRVQSMMSAPSLSLYLSKLIFDYYLIN